MHSDFSANQSSLKGCTFILVDTLIVMQTSIMKYCYKILNILGFICYGGVSIIYMLKDFKNKNLKQLKLI